MECTLCYDYLKKENQVFDENETCFYVEFPHEILKNWGMILPKRCCETVFDLNEEEILDTFRLLNKHKKIISDNFSPDGYNIGWNCYPIGGQDTPHAHLHLIPRFKDEPFAGRGIRYLFKKEENRRPGI